MLNMLVRSLLFAAVLATDNSVISSSLRLLNGNECLHAWSEKMTSPADCKISSDCKEDGASCVFSPLSDQYICCKARKGAVKPECPHGPAPIGLTVCDRKGSNQEEQCPSGQECVESATDFEKYTGQSNSICCHKL